MRQSLEELGLQPLLSVVLWDTVLKKVTQIYLDSFENKQIDEAMQHLV